MSKVVNQVAWVLWMLVVVALPFTSLPLVAQITGSGAVAPGSLLFLIPLVLVCFVLLVSGKVNLPFQVRPMLFFFLFSLLTVSCSLLRFIPDYKGQTILRAAIEGSATLILGFLFYLVSVIMLNSNQKIEATFRMLNWIGLVLILWSVFVFLTKNYFREINPITNELQKLMVTTRLLRERMTGFAYEPSWLAHQLNLVFLAYWLSATVNRTSFHKFRFLKLSFENILLLGGIVLLVGTFSRGGLAAFALVVAFLFILLNIKLIRKIITRQRRLNKTWITFLVIVIVIVMYLGIIVGGLFVLSKVDPRMEDVFSFSSDAINPLIKYADSLQFGERVIYWQTGWNIFNGHPIVGVGVGFSGFYFPEYLPDSGWMLTESRKLLYQSEGLLNIKSLWSRLLAETGIVGFSLFLTALVVTLFSSIDMVRSSKQQRRTVGYMAIFMLIALIIEGFSVDSFALPYIWFTLGVSVAAWRWYFPHQEGVVNG